MSCNLLKLMLCSKLTNLSLQHKYEVEMDSYQFSKNQIIIMSKCLQIIVCLWAPMQSVNEKCTYSSLCTTVLLSISLTNSSHTSLFASDVTTTNS